MKVKLDWIIEEPERTPAAQNLSLDVDTNTILSLYSNALVDKDYYDYIKGKTVVIVGPANYLKGKERGKFFDSFDIIVRLNKSYPILEEDKVDLGSYTNIRYHNACMRENEGGPMLLEYAERSGLRYVSSIFPRHLSYFDNDIKLVEAELKDSNVKLHCFADLEQYLTFHLALKTRPNAGVAAIMDLLNYNPSRLHISGFSFFNTPYIDSYKGRRQEIPQEYQNNLINNHAQGPQKDLIKLYMENFNNITADKEVIEYLQ